MKNFKDYNKAELFERIEKISIEKVGDQVVTKYDGRVINTSSVSNRYEIFDIVKYLKDKIEVIESNFKINKYEFRLTRGQQYLKLISDKVLVGGVEFYKSFYILNSTDKSRRLSFHAGLYSEKNDFYMINNVKNVGLIKKHLKGVTQAAEEASSGLNGETFDDQIKSIESIVGHRILLSKIRETILGTKEEIPQINHRKFDAFKNVIRHLSSQGRLSITKEQHNMLSTESTKLISIERTSDFYIDAFDTFRIYLTLFNRQDSHIIKNETDRILGITQWAVRNNVLESIGI